MSFIPTAKGFVYNMDLFVAQPPVNHSLTSKPLAYKNNSSHATVIKLLSKDFCKRRKPAQILGFYSGSFYSNSIVAGGLPVQS